MSQSYNSLKNFFRSEMIAGRNYEEERGFYLEEVNLSRFHSVLIWGTTWINFFGHFFFFLLIFFTFFTLGKYNIDILYIDW